MTDVNRWPFARVIAHRGGGILAPENTLVAIRVGIDHGYRAVEFDAMLAADDTPVLMHDETLARTAGRQQAVSALAATELAMIDVGRWHSPRFAGETVPTLTAALALCRDHDVWPNVEIKPAPGLERATGRAVARVVSEMYADLRAQRDRDARYMNERSALPLLSSFSIEALEAAAEAEPWLPRGWLVEQIPANWQASAAALGVIALHANHRHLAEPHVRRVIDAGLGLFCYTVNDPARARLLFDWGVDAFCTDRIELIGADFV